jgi:hypothetical protein
MRMATRFGTSAAGRAKQEQFGAMQGQNCTPDAASSRNRLDSAFLNGPTPLPGDQFKS